MSVHKKFELWIVSVIALSLIYAAVMTQISYIAERETHCNSQGYDCNRLPNYLSVYDNLPSSLKPRTINLIYFSTTIASFQEAINLIRVTNNGSHMLSWTAYNENGTLSEWQPTHAFTGAVRTVLLECNTRLDTLDTSTVSKPLFIILILSLTVLFSMHSMYLIRPYEMNGYYHPNWCYRWTRNLSPVILVLTTFIIILELFVRIRLSTHGTVPSLPLCNEISNDLQATCHMSIDADFDLALFISGSVTASTTAMQSVTIGYYELIVFGTVYSTVLLAYIYTGWEYAKILNLPRDNTYHETVSLI